MPPESPAAIHMHDRADAVSACSVRSGLNAEPRQGSAAENGRNIAREPREEAAGTGNSGKSTKAAEDAGAAGAAAPENAEDESVATGMSSSASGAVAGVFGGVLLWVIVMDGAGMQAGSPSVPLLLFLFVIAGAFAGWLFSGGPGRRGHESADDGEAASHSGDSAAENEQNVRH